MTTMRRVKCSVCGHMVSVGMTGQVHPHGRSTLRMDKRICEGSHKFIPFLQNARPHGEATADTVRDVVGKGSL